MNAFQAETARRGVAIVGLSGRYPGGAETPAKLWENLKAGIDAVGEARGDRWDLGHHHPDPARPERVYTRACGLLERIDAFDHEFFGLSPREARQVDPQQRLLLELAWEALEDASIPRSRIAGTDAGVFVGISSNDYASLVGPQGPDAYSNTGSSFSIAANRISYFLDLHGPSMAIDTACSSTIVGVHQACTSLLAGDCSIALAGGISLLVHIRPWLGFAKASMLSPTGRCKSFDASGDGYVRSEGGGIAVLKTLEAAERDGDAIYGVILASGVNSDGHTLGLSMPNVDAQERLLRKVYAACGVPPEDVVYVEAHGTGTSVGDPIECESLGRVLGVPRADGSTCLVGSVKSNIGHLEAASGMAGLTKALLVLRHREIPANLHFKTPNPKIKFDEWKLEVVSTTRPLPERGKPVVVGVNSFGFGGTNAHLAIAEYRPPALEHRNGHATRRQNLLLLSGHTPEALRAVAEDYAGFLKTQPEAAWTEICAAAALCRSEHRHRLALAAESPAEAAQKLERWAAGEPVTRLATGSAGERRARVAFVYSGNGPQWWGMGRELMASVAQFRHEIERIDAIFQPLAGWSLVEEMRRPESESRTALTEYAQPLLFAQQVALGALLRSSGIAPAVTLGHSVGEVAAAYEAGALSLEQAVLVIYNRSLQQAKTAGMGTMAAIGMSSDEALQAMREIPGWLELAASNAPKAVTVAGDPAALEALRAAVTEAGKFARILPLQYAFHSTAMDAVKDDLLEALQALTPGAGTIPFLSTVDVETKAGPALGAQYWWRNVREPVRFYEAVDRLIAEGTGVFVEIGPHPVLRDYIVQCAKAREANVTALATLRRPAANRPEPELDNLWTAVCACFASGAGAPETIFTRPQPVPALPMYPWQRSRHWRGWTALPDQHHPVEREHPLLGYRISAGDGLWENTLDVNQLRYLRDHEVQGSVVFPAAAYVESGLAAARLLLGEGTLDLESFEILRPLTIPEHTDPLVQLAADAKDGTFAISSRADKHFGNWTQNVRGRLSRADVSHPPETLDLGALREKLPCRITASEHYAAAANRGLRYGPAFQGITNIWMSSPGEGPREALAEIELESLAEGALSPYLAHPSLTDSGVQVILSLIGQTERRLCSVIPVSIERVRSYAPVPNHFFCRVTIASESERSAVADFQMLDADGKLVLGLLGTRCQKVGFSSGSASSLIAEWWRPDPAAPDLFAQPLQLPEPGHVAAALGGDVGEALDEFDRRTFYRDVQPALDRLAGAYAVKALAELGAAGGPFDLARLMRRGRVKQQHARLLASVVEMAAADGQLGVEENGWVWNASRDPEEPARLWRELLQAHPRYLTELLLLARAGDELAATLRSDAPAEPHEGSGPLEQLFDSAPFQAVYNRLARALVRKLVETWPAGRPLRIVEAGGAGGGLTAALLPMLPPLRTDYLFTDVSEAALARAEHRFGRYEFVRFARLDLERNPGSQGLATGSFDVAIAGNALHAANDAAAALAGLASLLVPGGALLALESHPQRFCTLVFGRDPAWWQVDDTEFRDASRLAAAEAWPDLFARTGFEGTAALSDSGATPNAIAQQTVFLARKSLAAPAPAQAGAQAEARNWLILAGPAEHESAALEMLRRRLAATGGSVSVHVLPDGAGLDDDAARTLIAESDADSIVHFAGAAARPAFELPAAQREARCLSALRLVQAVEALRHDDPPQLTFVTRGALASPFEGPLNPGHAPLWGLVRVIGNEHPSLGCRLIDLHAELADAEAGAWLAAELLRRDAETEVALCGGTRYVNRERLTTLDQLGQAERPSQPKTEAFRLDFVPQGGLDSLHLRALERREPAPHEVEIRVCAAGLNFRDVLWAMGMLPEEAVEKGFSGPTIGMECAGEVVRAGSEVRDLRAGDRVIAFASSCFASYVTTDAGSVARIPEALDFEEAATIPIAFLTAYYALEHLARLAPGETVLIHGAAGGVGLAALQIAKLKGARVIGTAGSPAKRRVVEMLGADHVLDSRSLEFADDVMRLSGGTGVDVVLNSLAGEAIAKGLQILRPFGRFLEIGKRDLYANSRIGLRPFRQNLSYFGIDADTLLIERAELARQLFRTVAGLFETGELRPIPFQAVPVSRAAEAFRTMQQSKHIGKIVISLRSDAPQALAVLRTEVPVRADGTYLVTGGLGGFGLTTARWLVAQGARSLALVGRRGAATDEARDAVAALERAGAAVRTFAADVSDPSAVERVVRTVRGEMLPLRGVIHSAAVIEDAPVVNITGELLERVFEPKARGAWNLHAATLRDPLEMFVLYSSVSVLVGNPGQAAYVAANIYLESLVQYRRALGLPGMAVGWGAIKDAGFLTRNAAVADMLKHRSGLDATPAAEALAELGRLSAAGAERVCIARYNLQRLGQMLAGARVPRFAPIIPRGLDVKAEATESLADRLKSAAPGERRGLIVARVCEHAGRVLGTGASQMAVDRPLSEMGLDSLMAVELAEAVERDVKQPISVMQMLGAGSIGAIADLVLKTLGLEAEGESRAASAPAAKAAAAERNGSGPAHAGGAQKEFVHASP